MAAQLHSRPHAIGLFQNMLRRWEGLLALATCALTVFYTVFVFAGWGSPEQQVLIANILSPIITLIAAGFGLYVAQRGQIDQRTRWAWHLFALAFLANGLGSIAWAIYESVLQVYPSTSWADVGWLAFYPFLLTAVMVFPTAPYRRNDLLTFWLDAGTVLIGGSMLIWYFSFGP